MRDRLPALAAITAALLLTLTGCSWAQAAPFSIGWLAFLAACVLIVLINRAADVRRAPHLAAARVAEAHAKRSQTELERARLHAGLTIAKESTLDA